MAVHLNAHLKSHKSAAKIPFSKLFMMLNSPAVDYEVLAMNTSDGNQL